MHLHFWNVLKNIGVRLKRFHQPASNEHIRLDNCHPYFSRYFPRTSFSTEVRFCHHGQLNNHYLDKNGKDYENFQTCKILEIFQHTTKHPLVDISEYFIFCPSSSASAFHIYHGRFGTICKQGYIQLVELGGEHWGRRHSPNVQLRRLHE